MLERDEILVFGANGFIGQLIVSELETDISKKVIKLDKNIVLEGDVYVDVTDEKSIQETVTTLKKTYKNIRTVIYCVGSIVPGNIRKVSTTDFKKSLSTNLIGAYCLAEQMIDYFLNNKAGHFIFLSSVFGHVVGPNLISYNISKAALNQLSKSIAEDFKDHNIISNTISIGLIDSPFIRNLPNEKIDGKKWMNIMKLENNNYTDPKTVVKTISFLMEQGISISGSDIVVDSGYSLH